MKSFLFVLVVVLIGVAFGVGYWPQRQRMLIAQEEAKQTRIALDEARARVQLCELQGQLLEIIEKAREQNYGDAQALATKFFDRVQAAQTETPRADYREALAGVARLRDAVTAGFTRGSAETVGLLEEALGLLRRVTRAAEPSPSATLPAKSN